MDPWLGHWQLPVRPDITVRVDRHTWDEVLGEINDFTRRERAGVLFVRSLPRAEPELLVGVEWLPVPDDHVQPSTHGLSFDGRFNLRVAARAAELGAGALLVHAHPGDGPPRPSNTDARNGAAFLQFLRRRCPDAAHGLLVVADTTITSIIEANSRTAQVDRVVAAGIPTRTWSSQAARHEDTREEDRQLLAIGAAAQKHLGGVTIAVIGNSGGGSHVTQDGRSTTPYASPSATADRC